MKTLKTSRAVARLLLFFALAALAAFGFHQLLNFSLRSIETSSFGALNRAMAGNVNAQILISGSSRALVHYDPRVIQEFTGKSAYNVGRNGSHIDMQLALLQAYLRHNTKPEIVIHNLDLHSLQATPELYDPAQYLPFLSDPDLYAAIRRISPDAWKWRHIPLYGYAVEDMRLTWIGGLRSLVSPDDREDHFMGFNPRYLKWTGDFERFKDSNVEGFDVPINDSGQRAFSELIALCRNQGIELILVYAPEYWEAQRLTRNRAVILEHFRRAAAAAQIQFWDFSEHSLSRNREYFYNSQHLNAEGAAHFSLAVASRLREK